MKVHNQSISVQKSSLLIPSYHLMEVSPSPNNSYMFITTHQRGGRRRQNKIVKDNMFFKPFFIVLRLTGIESDPFRGFSRRIELLNTLFSFLLFFGNVWGNIYFTFYEFNSLTRFFSSDGKLPTTFPLSSMLGFLIDYGSFDFMVISVHAALLFLTRKPEWKLLIENLKHLAADKNGVSINKRHRIVMAGVILLILVRYFCP